MELLKKIVTKSIIGDPKKFLVSLDDGETCVLYRVYGTANGVRSGENTNGPWMGFSGQFEAMVVDENGEMQAHYGAPQCFLYEPMTSMLADKLRESDSVDFAVEVLLKRSDSSITGYEYIVKPLLEMQENDSLAHLRQLALPKLDDE